MRGLEEILDIHEILRLKARYCRVMDEKKWHEWHNIFTPDAILIVPEVENCSRVTGVDAIIEFVSSRLKNAVTIHQLHAPEIEITSEDSARGIWALEDRLLWSADRPGPRGARYIRGAGHYHELYRRTAKGWRIAQLELTRLLLERG